MISDNKNLFAFLIILNLNSTNIISTDFIMILQNQNKRNLKINDPITFIPFLFFNILINVLKNNLPNIVIFKKYQKNKFFDKNKHGKNKPYISKINNGFINY